jgi:hypothetical protein
MKLNPKSQIPPAQLIKSGGIPQAGKFETISKSQFTNPKLILFGT